MSRHMKADEILQKRIVDQFQPDHYILPCPQQFIKISHGRKTVKFHPKVFDLHLQD